MDVYTDIVHETSCELRFDFYIYVNIILYIKQATWLIRTNMSSKSLSSAEMFDFKSKLRGSTLLGAYHHALLERVEYYWNFYIFLVKFLSKKYSIWQILCSHPMSSHGPCSSLLFCFLNIFLILTILPLRFQIFPFFLLSSYYICLENNLAPSY